MSVEYLFRDWSAMPLIEKKSISVSYWKTLDVGSGAGSHSYIYKMKKTSNRNRFRQSNKTCQLRGIKNT
jgi:hypothetical protein